MKDFHSFSKCLVLQGILVVSCKSASSKVENHNFKIIAPVTYEDLTNYWSTSSNKLQFTEHGIDLARPKEFMSSQISFNEAIDTNSEWDVELRIKTTKKSKGKKKMKVKDNVNAFIISLTDYHPGANYSPKKQQINQFGANIVVLMHSDQYFIAFKHSNSELKTTNTYVDLLYNELWDFEKKDPQYLQYHKNINMACQMHVTDEFKIRVTFQLSAHELSVETFNKRNEYWETCFIIPNINRFIYENHHIFSIQAMSAKEDSYTISLEDASLHEKKLELVSGAEAEVKEDLARKMMARIRKQDKSFDDGDHDVAELHGTQEKLMQQSKVLSIYTKDFHDGILKFQEYLLHKNSKLEGKDVDDNTFIKGILEKILQLEERQSSIYQKFLKVEGFENTNEMLNSLHKRYSKLDSKLKALTNLLDNDYLDGIIKKSGQVFSDFEKEDWDVESRTTEMIQKHLKERIRKNYHALGSSEDFMYVAAIWIFLCCCYIVFAFVRSKKKNSMGHSKVGSGNRGSIF